VSVTVYFHGGPQDGTSTEIGIDVPPFELTMPGLPPVIDLTPRHDDPTRMPPYYVHRLSGPGSVHYLYHGER
jgi:hypothetical protein